MLFESNNNNYDNLYGAVTRPYRYRGMAAKWPRLADTNRQFCFWT